MANYWVTNQGTLQLNSKIQTIKPLIMKNANKSARAIKNFDQLISVLSEKDILDVNAMSSVRGGDGDGTGGELIIIIPPTRP